MLFGGVSCRCPMGVPDVRLTVEKSYPRARGGAQYSVHPDRGRPLQRCDPKCGRVPLSGLPRAVGRQTSGAPMRGPGGGARSGIRKPIDSAQVNGLANARDFLAKPRAVSRGEGVCACVARRCVFDRENNACGLSPPLTPPRRAGGALSARRGGRPGSGIREEVAEERPLPRTEMKALGRGHADA